MYIKNKINIKISYITISTVLTIVFFYTYIQFNKKLIQIEKNIIDNEISNISKFAFNISKYIVLSTNDTSYFSLKGKTSLIKNIENNLSLFKTSKYINIFVLHKTKDGKLRYVFDAEEDITKKGEYGQKFDPQNSIWDKLYKTKQPQYDTQKDLEELWITYLHPIIRNKEVKYVIVFDFSTNSYIDTVDMILPLKNFFFYLTLTLIVILILSYIQLYLQYKNKLSLYIDALTSIYNRYFLKTLMNDDMNLQPYEICMLDIDFFKNINDNYGHRTGDIVLKNFAKRVQNSIKEKDIFIRYGGEEFLLFLFKNNNNKIPNEVYERIKTNIMENPIIAEKEKINITVSLGVNRNPHLSNSIEEAISIADEQLYISKNNGRNTISYTN